MIAPWMGVAALAVEAQPRAPVVGETERVYALAAGSGEVRGIAAEETQLYVLDASGSIHVYAAPAPEAAELAPLRSIRVPPLPDGRALADPRGLALARRSGRLVFHLLGRPGPKTARSELWSFAEGAPQASLVDLSARAFRVGARDFLGVARDRDTLVLSFDTGAYDDRRERLRRGLLRLSLSGDAEGVPRFVKHMPDSGHGSSLGLGFMSLEGASYLWGTAGDEAVYVADAKTGRGVFAFPMPRAEGGPGRCAGLAFGDGALWVAEARAGSNRLLRVNVARNLDAPQVGPRIVRHLVMSIETEPEGEQQRPGSVAHYYSRPYSEVQIGTQGVWPESERLVDLSAAANASLRKFVHDPAGDPGARQHMASVEYAEARARPYRSRYEIDLWTNPYRRFVYPHRVDSESAPPAGTGYLADDAVLYNLKDRAVYEAFFERVERYIEREYGEPADMRNRYWAARNAMEYIMDHYYYPIPELGAPAAVDYSREHYDANPGNLKLDLSRKPYDQSQIIACSGTSVMLAGAMRSLGIPARWLGTATPKEAVDWDADGDGLLEPGELAPAVNGHRLNQVWLGAHYGWVEFDATPARPIHGDYDVPPPPQSQWMFMTRAAAGLRRPKRIVFNIGSEFFPPLYRDFECDDPKLAAINNCGGDQRYNLQGRFEKKEAWRRPRHAIEVTNPCWLEAVALGGTPGRRRVEWRPTGAWERDPEARLSVVLQRLEAGGPRDVATLAEAVPYAAGSVPVDLSGHAGTGFRVIVRKRGDPETGGHSPPFDLPIVTTELLRGGR